MSTRRRHWHRYRNFDPSARDYQGADFFIPAGAGHFRRVRRGRVRTIKHIVIHITGGPGRDEGSSINEFRREGGHASAHYIINRQGNIVQMVREANIAYHLTSGNSESIGIEHVNMYHPRDLAQRETPEEVQYETSARLVASLCAKYGVPCVRSMNRGTYGIIGHCDIDENTLHRNCPNGPWAWGAYLAKVERYYTAEMRRLHDNSSSDRICHAELPNSSSGNVCH